MTKIENVDERPNSEYQATINDILKLFDERLEPALSSAQLLSELPIDRGTLEARLEKMREDGLVGRISTDHENTELQNEFKWWPTVAPRLSVRTVDRIFDAGRHIDQGETVPLEGPHGQVMENVRTVKRVHDSLMALSLLQRDQFKQRIREMDTDPESTLIPSYARSEHILKFDHFRAVVRWNQMTYMFYVLDVGPRTRIYE